MMLTGYSPLQTRNREYERVRRRGSRIETVMSNARKGGNLKQNQ